MLLNVLVSNVAHIDITNVHKQKFLGDINSSWEYIRILKPEGMRTAHL